jgi:hypothetical protein
MKQAEGMGIQFHNVHIVLVDVDSLPLAALSALQARE